jgi:hypothetical protein
MNSYFTLAVLLSLLNCIIAVVMGILFRKTHEQITSTIIDCAGLKKEKEIKIIC